MRGAICYTLLAFCSVAILAGARPAYAEKADGTRMVCKYQMQTGTRFKKKTCKTVAEWEAIAEAARAGAGELMNRPAVETRRDDPGRITP